MSERVLCHHNVYPPCVRCEREAQRPPVPVPSERQTAPFQRHSPESRAAARRIEPKAHIARGRVLEYIRSRPEGATDQEIQQALDMDPSTERPRRVELWRAKLIVRGPRTRRTSSGRQAAIWFAAPGWIG